MDNKKNIKNAIKREFVKCAESPAYFMKKYCVIQHPIDGKIPFALYEFQEKTLYDKKNKSIGSTWDR